MKLDMFLLPHERMVIIDWDRHTYVVYYENGDVAEVGLGHVWQREWPDDLLEWLPEQ